MNPKTTSSLTSRNVDTEAQAQSNNRGGTSSLDTAGSRRSTSSNNSEHRKERLRVASVDERDGQDVTEALRSPPPVNIASPHETIPPSDTPTQAEWKPWRADEPLLTKVPKIPITQEKWVEVMKASDDGMCTGWKEQIDILVIFAGLFSATVTAFTVESYKWLEETPANMLARLQLRSLLSTTHDPASLDRLAPATFNISSASIVINTLWFASLTLSLTAVVVSILCKQWLYEYQRYDNFTTEEAFLIRGIRHRGLEAWRVPEIIASLPLLLQTALVLFLVGILVLLWPLQTIVVSISTVIVGLTFLFLGITTALPSIQYIFPHFDTQCAYKSSQSWSFFIVSAFWLFDFAEFTSWASFDHWETRVYTGAGSTLSRVYKLLSNNADAVLGIYTFLADRSLKPTIHEHLALLSEFINHLDTPQIPYMNNASSLILLDYEHYYELQRLKQLRGWLGSLHNSFGLHRRLKPRMRPYNRHSSNAILGKIDYAYYSGIHSILSEFLCINHHISHPALFNRFIEHWARSVAHAAGHLDIAHTPQEIYSADIQYDPDIAMCLVGIHGHIMNTHTMPNPHLFSTSYLGFIESYHQRRFTPPPVTLLKNIQDWINRMPKSNPRGKASYTDYFLDLMAMEEDFLRKFTESHTSELEKQYLISFMRFFVTLYEREDILADRESLFTENADAALAFFRAHLDQNDNGDVEVEQKGGEEQHTR